MAEASDKYDEKVESPGHSTLTLPLPPSQDLEPEREFADVTAPSRPQSQALRPGSLHHTISHTRSNNGYGCCEGDASSEDVEAAGVVEKDPWEVHWDGGDSDPLNPRSFAKARKWVIVIIVSMSSLCV